MKRKWTRTLAVLACVLCALLALQLLAAADTPYTLTVWGCAPELVDMRKDLNVADGGDARLRYDLYKIAVFNGDYTFTVEKAFSGINIPPNIDSDGWRKIAIQAAKIIFLDEDENIKKELTIKADKSDLCMGSEKPNIDRGLYLVVAHPFKTPHTEYVDKNKDGNVITRFQGEENRYIFLPDLITVPTWSEVDGERNTATGELINKVEVVLKPEVEELYGSIKITKTLRSYNSDSKVTFGFRVTAKKDGVVVHNKVYSMDFTQDGFQERLISGLPVGATVTVEEFYEGSNCVLVKDEVVTPVDPKVKVDDIIEFRFVNEGSNTNKGHGILNHFVYKDGQWVLSTSETPEGGETQ